MLQATQQSNSHATFIQHAGQKVSYSCFILMSRIDFTLNLSFEGSDFTGYAQFAVGDSFGAAREKQKLYSSD
ncbi:hypothetical protein [Terriglobus sp. ADX1]|uniref:hypothetical protein n=1 Tax=Terriglobus sp. ADX1 TaxID=2794063 RepID=UPI002FE68FA1